MRKSCAYYNRLCKKVNNISFDDECANDFPSTENISEAAENREIRRNILKLIDSLGEPDSTIIMQKYYYGRNSREISKFVSLSPAMIRVRNSRALKKLRKLLSENGIYF